MTRILLGEACLAHEHKDLVACQHPVMVLVALLEELHCRRQCMLLGTGGWLVTSQIPTIRGFQTKALSVQLAPQDYNDLE